MKKLKIIVIVLISLLIVGCSKKTSKVYLTTSAKPVIPIQTSLFKEAQNKLKTLQSITIEESLLLNYGENQHKNIYYNTNLSKTKGLMKINGVYNDLDNTVYIKKEDNKYVVYPKDKVNGKNVKYELGKDFVLDVSNNKVLNYLMSNINEVDYKRISNNTTTIYEATLTLKALGNDKTMLDDIIYHYVTNKPEEVIYDESFFIRIELDNNSKSFKSIIFDLTNLFDRLDLDFQNQTFTYEITLTNYNEDKVYFPYQSSFYLDDAPDSFKNYIYYYSNKISTLYKELKPGIINTGTIDFESDLDIYSFVIPVKTLVNVKVNADIPFNYFVTDEVNNNLSEEQKNNLNYVKVFEPGRYYLGVKSDIVGEYQIDISFNDKFANYLNLFIENEFEIIDINTTNNSLKKIDFVGEMDIFYLKNQSYLIKNPKLTDLNLILVNKYDEHFEYEFIYAETFSIKQTEICERYLIMYSSGYTGNYNLEINLKK